MELETTTSSDSHLKLVFKAFVSKMRKKSNKEDRKLI